MVEPEKPFACTLPDCGMTFTNEDHLHVHTKKHDMVLQLGLEQKAAFVADQTPTPTRFIRNCEEVGLFQDLQNVTVNPFDEGFKRAMETKHCILSLENAIANPSSDDVLHTPQMVFPLIDSGDSTLFSTTNNQRNITISRSSSDESGTIKEYETTTISKSTNEVTTISRIIGNREQNDKDDKHTDIINNRDNIETVSYKNNVIKIQSNVEIRKEDNKIPVLVYTDSVIKDSSVTKDVLLTDSSKLEVDKVPPIMSQKSLDFVVDSLTSDIAQNVHEKSTESNVLKRNESVTDKTHNDSKVDSNNTLKDIQVNNVDDENSKVVKQCIRKGRIEKNDGVTKKIVRKPKLLPKTLSTDDYEVIIKLPDGKQVRMKAVEEMKSNQSQAKQILRHNLTRKLKIDRNTVPINFSHKNASNNQVNSITNITSPQVLQIPTGTLIPVKLLSSGDLNSNLRINNTINASKIVVTNKVPIPVANIGHNNRIAIPVTPTLTPVTPTSNNLFKLTALIKETVTTIAPQTPKCPPPFADLKISQPFQIRDSTNKKKDSSTAEREVVRLTPEETVEEKSENEETRKQDDDVVIEKVVNNAEVAKRTRYELESRCAASKRYRVRLRDAMKKQTEEIRQLREANQRLIAEKAVLKLLITEHMKRCPNADDLRITQERLQSRSAQL